MWLPGAPAIVDFLGNYTTSTTNENGLQVLLNKWLETESDFAGAYEIKVGCLGVLGAVGLRSGGCVRTMRRTSFGSTVFVCVCECVYVFVPLAGCLMVEKSCDLAKHSVKIFFFGCNHQQVSVAALCSLMAPLDPRLRELPVVGWINPTRNIVTRSSQQQVRGGRPSEGRWGWLRLLVTRR